MVNSQPNYLQRAVGGNLNVYSRVCFIVCVQRHVNVSVHIFLRRSGCALASANELHEFVFKQAEKSSVPFEWQPVLLALISIKLPLAANDPARSCARVLLALAACALCKPIPLYSTSCSRSELAPRNVRT